MSVRRGANWTPPKNDALCFEEKTERAEICIHCGKHISRHFGSTEYRCYSSKEEIDRAINKVDDALARLKVLIGDFNG